MTWRIFPSAGLRVTPSCARVRLGPARPRSKNQQKTDGNYRFQSKCSFLGHKLARQGFSELHPPKLEEIHSENGVFCPKNGVLDGKKAFFGQKKA